MTSNYFITSQNTKPSEGLFLKLRVSFLYLSVSQTFCLQPCRLLLSLGQGVSNFVASSKNGSCRTAALLQSVRRFTFDPSSALIRTTRKTFKESFGGVRTSQNVFTFLVECVFWYSLCNSNTHLLIFLSFYGPNTLPISLACPNHPS